MFGDVVPFKTISQWKFTAGWASEFHGEHCIGMRELLWHHVFKDTLSFKAKSMMYKGLAPYISLFLSLDQ
jgi:hypothetical protein